MGKVVIGWLYNGPVPGEFARSLAALSSAMSQFLAGQICIQGSSIVYGRNQMVREFLAMDAEWLWMVDSDMVFDPDCLFRLLQASDETERPIVGGLCFGMREGRIFPTLFVLRGGESYIVEEWKDNTVTRVSATGAACLLIHRTVLEKMQANFPAPLPWFADEVQPSGKVRGEDITFCVRAGALGFPVFVHTGVKVGHVKTQIITEETYGRSRPDRQDERESAGPADP